ncbi:unnamed protein product [Cyclocybe aegerita]|uniref:Uncharacterized protein n=1 Tax=Cyclocybe aegerita TaxID=1973307 RepID=A0A8S0XRG9_CYCAE|nr:unnamed protein product [Cyclocybe aegerita]
MTRTGTRRRRHRHDDDEGRGTTRTAGHQAPFTLALAPHSLPHPLPCPLAPCLALSPLSTPHSPLVCLPSALCPAVSPNLPLRSCRPLAYLAPFAPFAPLALSLLSLTLPTLPSHPLPSRPLPFRPSPSCLCPFAPHPFSLLPSCPPCPLAHLAHLALSPLPLPSHLCLCPLALLLLLSPSRRFAVTVTVLPSRPLASASPPDLRHLPLPCEQTPRVVEGRTHRQRAEVTQRRAEGGRGANARQRAVEGRTTPNDEQKGPEDAPMGGGGGKRGEWPPTNRRGPNNPLTSRGRPAGPQRREEEEWRMPQWAEGGGRGDNSPK